MLPVPTLSAVIHVPKRHGPNRTRRLFSPILTLLPTPRSSPGSRRLGYLPSARLRAGTPAPSSTPRPGTASAQQSAALAPVPPRPGATQGRRPEVLRATSEGVGAPAPPSAWRQDGQQGVGRTDTPASTKGPAATSGYARRWAASAAADAREDFDLRRRVLGSTAAAGVALTPLPDSADERSGGGPG